MKTNTPFTYPALSSYLTVSDGAKAIAFYTSVFGATERFRLTDAPSGKVGHAELLIDGNLLMLSDEFPGFNKTPGSLGGTPVKLSLLVADVDAVTARAETAGATVLMPPADQFYGFRSASIRDPFGHEWMLQRQIEDVPPEEMQRRWDAMTKC